MFVAGVRLRSKMVLHIAGKSFIRTILPYEAFDD
jgi:hypothetical protein